MKVLVISEDTVQARLISALLEREGLEVLSSERAEEAVALLLGEGCVDLIVADLSVPVNEGWNFYRTIHSPGFASLAQIPVVAISSTWTEDDLGQLPSDLGVDTFLPAPVDPAALHACIRGLLEKGRSRPSREILLAFPQPGPVQGLRHALEARHFTVHLATSGEEARRLFLKNPIQTVLLSDALPDARDQDLLAEFRSARPLAVILLATSHSRPEKALEAIQHGADAYVSETIDAENLEMTHRNVRLNRMLVHLGQHLKERQPKSREMENQFHLITDHIPAILWTTDRELLITSSVGTALSRLNLKPGQLVGTKLTDYLKTEDPDFLPLAAHYRALQGEKVTYDMEWGGRMWHTRIEPLLDATGRISGTTAVTVDITSRRQIEMELNARVRQQAAIVQLSQVALKGTDLGELLNKAVQAIAETLEVEFCHFLELLPSGQELRLQAAVGWEANLVGQLNAPFPSKDGPEVPLDAPSAIHEDEFESHPQSLRLEYLRERGARSGVSLVLRGQTGPFGVLGVRTTLRRKFTDHEVHFLQVIGNILSAANERRRSEERQKALIEGLHAVVGVADQLIRCVEVDELYRRAVELARENLGLERCGICVESSDGVHFQGTYGTDEFGRTTSEQNQRVPKEEFKRWMKDEPPVTGETRWVLRRDRFWTYWDGEKTVEFGQGWIAATPIHSSKGQIGILFNDAAITKAPFDEVKQEIAAVFVSVLGTLVERKQTEEALRESEEKYRALFLESKDAIFISTPEGKYIDMNPAGIEMLGYSSKDEVLQLNIAKDLYFDPADRDKFLRIIEENGFVKDFELRLKRKDGQPVVVQATVTAVRDSQGKVVAYRGTRRDITEQKRLQQQLIQAQKMESIGTLAGGIAHDFNNILTGIIGYAELSLGMLEPGSKVYQFIANIPEQGQRAAGLISQLLAFSRRAITRFEPINLLPLVKEIGKMLRRTLPENIDIRMKSSGEIELVNADPTQMQQVIMNLATNAQDAMPAGGTLLLELDNVTLDRHYCRRYPFAKPGRYVCLTVRDTGLGMSPEIMDHIFEPFFTTKDIGKGTGLGLSMVYGIVKTHNGHITVQSKPGMGSEFKIYLPIIETGLPRSRAIPMSSKALPKGGRETLLLVEDEVMVLNVGRQILESLGYRVLTATNGKEGLELFRARHREIQLVLMDFIMPEMGGDTLFEELLKIDPEVKTILISGYSLQEKIDSLRAKGLNGLVLKPFTLHGLATAVREALGETKAPSPFPSSGLANS